MPATLVAGITIDQFWELTLAEINLYVDAYNQRRKENIIRDYELAKLNAICWGCAFAGKEFPTIESLYPSLFEDIQASEEEEQKQMKLYLEQFRDYADWHNKKRGGDNG